MVQFIISQRVKIWNLLSWGNSILNNMLWNFKIIHQRPKKIFFWASVGYIIVKFCKHIKKQLISSMTVILSSLALLFFPQKYIAYCFKLKKKKKKQKLSFLEAAFSISLINIGSCSFSAWVNFEEGSYLACDEW